MEGILKNSEDMEDEVRILEEMKALYQKTIIRRQVGKPTRTNFFKDLPDHVFYDILVKLPSRDLFENARLVCHTWRRIISTGDFIAQSFLSARDELLIGMKKTSLKDSFVVKEMVVSDELEFKLLDFGLSRMGRVRSSCNGMILVNDFKKNKGVLKVMNPTTRVGLTLPRCPSGCPHKACGSALGFDPISKVNKVVHIYADTFGFEIANLISSELTWRRIPRPWENLHERPFNVLNFYWRDPVLLNNGRYLHWFVDSNEYIISLDITREISTRTNLPHVGEKIKTHNYSLVELGGFLGFTYVLSDCQLDVWILDNFTKQSWSKKHCIMTELVNYGVSEDPLRSREFENALPKIDKLVCVASLNDGKVLVLKHDSCLYLYDMGSRVMKKVKMTIKKDMFFILHRSSLLHWNPVNRDPSLSGAHGCLVLSPGFGACRYREVSNFF